MDAIQAKALLDRYLAGQATPEEIRLVQTMYDRLVQEGEWQWEEGEKEALQAMMEDRLLQKIDDRTAPVRSIPRFSKYIRRLAVAAIFIGISFATYFLIKNQKTTQPAIAAVPMKTDVGPGGNKAVLTLSNGTLIILDSARNGVLAKQGNVNVTKTDSGKLAYNMSSEKPVETGSNTLTTPRGGQYQLVLPDGTKVWLNAASSITYPTAFVGKERTVEVTGEAYFEVVHNAKQPFVVEAGDTRIEDIGTAFNVNAYPDEKVQKTTLLEGSVKVIAIKQSFVLKPGEQARVGDSWMGKTDNVNLTEVMAWRNGKIYLTDISLIEIMRNISRWYDVDINYTGNVPDKTFSGIIERNVPLSVVLGALKAFGVETELKDKTVIVH
jgi:transmembrane sensor